MGLRSTDQKEEMYSFHNYYIVQFKAGEYPTVEALVDFLEMNTLHDIVVVPTQELGLKHLKKHSIVCSGYTSKHIYKVAKDLVVELKKLKIPDMLHQPTICGRRDEEWLLVESGEVHLHLFVESFRREQDIVDRWLNPPSEDEVDWHRRFTTKMYTKNKFKL